VVDDLERMDRWLFKRSGRPCLTHTNRPPQKPGRFNGNTGEGMTLFFVLDEMDAATKEKAR
jgi:hypothetical protein